MKIKPNELVFKHPEGSLEIRTEENDSENRDVDIRVDNDLIYASELDWAIDVLTTIKSTLSDGE